MQQTYFTTLKVVETILSTHKLSGELVTKIDGIPLINGTCDVQIVVKHGKIVVCTITNGQTLLSGEDAKKILYDRGKLSLTLRDIQHTFGEKPQQSNVGTGLAPQQLPYTSKVPSHPNRQMTDPLAGILPSGQPYPYGSIPDHPDTDLLPHIQQFDHFNQYESGPHTDPLAGTPRLNKTHQYESGPHRQNTDPLSGMPQLNKAHQYESEPVYQIADPWAGIPMHQRGEHSAGPVTGPNVPIIPIASQVPVLYERSILQKTILIEEIDASHLRSWPHWQRQIFLLIDGSRTVQQILSLVSKDQPERVVRFLQELLSAGYIRIHETTGTL